MVKIIDYDKINDVLFIHEGFTSDEKFKGNIDIGKIVLDVSTKGKVKGIEIMGASEFFKEFGIEENDLENISDANICASTGPEGIIISISIKPKAKHEIPTKIAVPLEIHQNPNIGKSEEELDAYLKKRGVNIE